METRDGPRIIGERQLSEISSYYEIAKANRSLLTVEELIDWTSMAASERELLEFWSTNEALSSKYLIDSGYLVERGSGSERQMAAVAAERENRARARRNLLAASDFARLFKDGRTSLIALAGGNSYKSARDGDDIDLFCVTGSGSLWLFMLKALLLARVYRVANRTAPFCLSYVMEESRVLREFSESEDGLFARDALSANVLLGRGFYRSLLLKSEWMRRFFPRMYDRGLSQADPEEPDHGGKGGSRILNMFLFATLGTYVRMKAHLLNRLYISEGRNSSAFHVRMGVDHCVYESNRYRRLRAMYGSLGGSEAR